MAIRKETEWSKTLADKGNTLLFSDLSLIESISTDRAQDWDQNLYGNGLFGLLLKNIREK
ncbi:hypothetical protein OAL57_00420 [bacterium]|nr:hypothetical protein [bacterium]